MSTDTLPPPEVGEPAPEFELFTSKNEPWRLSEHLDTPVVLLFFPGAFTSVCTAELNSVNDGLHKFGDADVVGISTDSPFALDEYRSRHGYEFPLLSDHGANVSAKYGAKYQANFGQMNLDRISRRAAFVIDGEGVVRYKEILANAGKLPDFDAILHVVRGLNSGS